MGLNVGDYSFDGPYDSTEKLEDKSGVYMIVCPRDDKYAPVDCGESAEVKSRVENHDRKDCWNRNCSGALKFAVYYTPNLGSSGRAEIEQKIRSKYNFPCGVR